MFSKSKKKTKENSLMPFNTSSFTQTQNTITTTTGGITTTTRIERSSFQEYRSSSSITSSSLNSSSSGFTRLSNDRSSLPKSAFGNPIHNYNANTKSVPPLKYNSNELQKRIEYKPTNDAKPFPTTNTSFGSQLNQIKPSASNVLNSSNSNNVPLSRFQLNQTNPKPIVTTFSNVNQLKSNLNDSKNAFNNELNEKLKIKVKATGIYLGDGSKIPSYDTRSSRNRGKLLLINNIDFKDEKKKRSGAEVDQVNLVAVFKQIGFDILQYKNKTKAETERIVKSFASDSSLKKYDMCVTVIMSHGTTIDAQTVIETTDEKELPTEWVVQQFHGDICKGMNGKPKIFIFQCCRGDKSNSVLHTDGKPFQAPRKVQDILISYSTLPGFAAYRDPTLGSWYIQGLCKVFMEHAHDTHIEDLLKIVDDELKKVDAGPNHRQTSNYDNRGFKICYLNPIK
nr:caspase Dronc-like [Onthophagus taurus]